jgi:hypothetical protein
MSDAQLGLVAGLALAVRQLRANAKEATRWNSRALRNEKAFLLLLGVSVAGFIHVAGGERSTLSRERRAAAKALKVKEERYASVASLLHLDIPAAAAAAPRPRKARHTSDDAFWSELRYVLSIALPNGLASKGGALLATQFGLLVSRTLLSVKATKVSTYVLTRAISQASWPYWCVGWQVVSSAGTKLCHLQGQVVCELYFVDGCSDHREQRPALYRVAARSRVSQRSDACCACKIPGSQRILQDERAAAGVIRPR